jgi:hypothetical protein
MEGKTYKLELSGKTYRVELFNRLIRKHEDKLAFLRNCRDNCSSVLMEYKNFWFDLTEEIAKEFLEQGCSNLDAENFVVAKHYLVQLGDGIHILDEKSYREYSGKKKVLFQGSLQACKDFIKF